MTEQDAAEEFRLYKKWLECDRDVTFEEWKEQNAWRKRVNPNEMES